jgi:hypothetical protein
MERGERERLTSGARLSVRARKIKERERMRAGAGRGMVGCWAAWAERVAGAGFVVFFSFFSNFIFKSFFQLKFNSNFFKLFSRIL